MAEQLIIELMGDASGLAPAVEALKNMGRISQETSNTIIRTQTDYALQLGKTNALLGGQQQQVKNLNTAFGSMQQSIPVNSLTAYAAELKKNVEETGNATTAQVELEGATKNSTKSIEGAAKVIKTTTGILTSLGETSKEQNKTLNQISEDAELFATLMGGGAAAASALGVALGGLPLAVVGVGLGAVVLTLDAYKQGAINAKEAQERLNEAIRAGDQQLQINLSTIQDHENRVLQNIDKRIATARLEQKSQAEIDELEKHRMNREGEFINEKYNANKLLNDYLSKNYEARADQLNKEAKKVHDITVELNNRAAGKPPVMSERSIDLEKQREVAQRSVDIMRKQMADFGKIQTEMNSFIIRRTTLMAEQREKQRAAREAAAAKAKAAAEKANAERLQRIEKEIAQNQKNDREEIEMQLIKHQKLLKGEKEYSAAYIQLKKEEMQYKAQLELDQVTKSADSPELKTAKIGQLLEQLEADMNKLDSQATQHQNQLQAKASLSTAVNQGDTNVQNIKEQEAQAELTLTDKTEKEKLASKQSFMRLYHDAYVAELRSLEQWYLQNKGKDEQADKEYAERKKELLQKMSETEVNIAEQTADKKKQLQEQIESSLKQAALQAAQEISDAIFENQAQERQNELDTRLQHLGALKDAELSNTNLTNGQKKAIEDKYRRQEAAAKKAAWEADRDAKGEQAIINGLLAFTSALASSPPPMNYVNAAIALALAGVQAGIIWSKTPPKFAKGVIALQGPGTDTSDSIPALLSRGESVITASATRRYEPILKQMNAGTYEPLPIPMLSTLPRLRDLSGMTATAQRESVIDYDKLGKAVAANVKLPAQYHQTLDANGFTTHILNKGNRVQLYNNRMEL